MKRCDLTTDGQQEALLSDTNEKGKFSATDKICFSAMERRVDEKVEIRYPFDMDRKKAKKPLAVRPPVVAHDTIRRELLVELEEGPLSALELSGRISISEKDVYEHLEHIRVTLHRTGKRLAVQPAECVKCGFVFEKRERLKKPSKCPVCRSESIHDPLFSLVQERQERFKNS